MCSSDLGLTGRNALRLNQSLVDFSLKDESFLISKLRLVKSTSELSYVRKAAHLADKALEKAWELAHPGTDESSILAAMQGEVFAGGGDYPGNEFIIGSGEDALSHQLSGCHPSAHNGCRIHQYGLSNPLLLHPA